MATKYEKHYWLLWEKTADFKDCLRSVENYSARAYCTFCKNDTYAKPTDLKKHMSKKHKKNALVLFGIQNNQCSNLKMRYKAVLEKLRIMACSLRNTVHFYHATVFIL